MKSLKDIEVFEDGPFQDPQFAKFLSQHIDGSKFIYFQRPADDWYKSMVTHRGLTLGDRRGIVMHLIDSKN